MKRFLFIIIKSKRILLANNKKFASIFCCYLPLPDLYPKKIYYFVWKPIWHGKYKKKMFVVCGDIYILSRNVTQLFSISPLFYLLLLYRFFAYLLNIFFGLHMLNYLLILKILYCPPFFCSATHHPLNSWHRPGSKTLI